ncbi:MAG: response regulator, partial [Proteobacteria bacterium]|nr:response regulator [Pseudomonadota bacterium]
MKNLTAKQRIKVLIIDDEIGIRELLSEILLDEGYAVVTAHDAASAQQMRLQEAPEIILLDIWMPDMDGISLLRQWSEAGFPNVPVIIMSGHATIDTAVEATRLGALEVLEKPITTTRLLQAVEKAKI